jgi:RNA polymerase sigma-70 factor (ECF subfamily)
MAKPIGQARSKAMDESEMRMQLEQHHASSYGWALSCCSHAPHQAEDVLQAVYLKILQGRARFNGRAAFKTWLFAVIRMTAADERRREWLRHFRLLGYQRERGPDSELPQRGERIDQLARLREFERALVRLPKRQREILHLVGYQDMTLREASGVMGVSLGSARTHYDRGKTSLRAWLEKSEHFDEYKTDRANTQAALF